MLNDGSMILEWSLEVRTILVLKSSDLSIPKNFRLITCLNVLYKLWTDCFNESLLSKIIENMLILAIW